MDKRTVVVCGATGNLGGAALRGLLGKPEWNVVALSRNPDGDKAQALKNQGIEVRKADHEDLDSLKRAFSGAYGVFGVTQPWSPDYKKCDTECEAKQGDNIIAACLPSQIKHLVMSSVVTFGYKDKTGAKTGLNHADSKLLIVRRIRERGVPCTVLGPAQFMDNIGMPFFPVKKGSVRSFVKRDARVPYVASSDLGAFVAMAFAHPDIYIGQEIDLVGDFVSGDELAQILSKLRNGEPFKYKAIPRALMWTLAKAHLMPQEFWQMRVGFEELARPPYSDRIVAAIARCKELHPEMTSMEEFLRSKGYATKDLS